MLNKPKNWVHLIGIVFSITALGITAGRQAATAQGDKTISESDCTATRVETAIPVSAIGEPVSAVTLNPPRWIAATGNAPAHCSVDGSMAPVDRSRDGKTNPFSRCCFPASWNRRAAQIGGGGTNGVIPNLTGEPLQRGFALMEATPVTRIRRQRAALGRIQPHRTGGSMTRPFATSATCK